MQLFTVHYCRTVSPLKPSNGIFRLVNNLSIWPSSPEWLPVRHRQTEQREGYMRRGGPLGWNVSSRKSCLQGFSLSSLVSTVQSRHHLASWNATEQGVEGLRESPMLKGDGLWPRYGVLTVVVLTIKCHLNS